MTATITVGAVIFVRTTVICCAATAQRAHALGPEIPASLPLPANGCVCTTGSATMTVASRRIATRSKRIMVRLIQKPASGSQIPETALRRGRGSPGSHLE